MSKPSRLSECLPSNFSSIVKVEYEAQENGNCTKTESPPPVDGKKRPKRVLTEEQRKRQAEYKRKWKTRLTDEQRKKNAEYQREYRLKLTEKRRQKEVERDQERRANLTEEQRRRKRECDRKRRTFLTEEQRKMRAEYKRKWRARQTEEKRRRQAEIRRSRRANISEEQRKRERERDRERRANLTEEQRRRKTECDRKRREFLTEEQRKIYLRRRQLRAQYIRANLTEEQRKKRSEYIRKYNAKISAEQRTQRSEWYRNWYAKLTVEQRRIRVERRQRRLNLTAEKNLRITTPKNGPFNINLISSLNCKRILKPKLSPLRAINIIKHDIHNPLRYLIKQIGCDIDAIITSLDKRFFIRILQMLSLDYPQDIVCPIKYSKDIIIYEIDINCLIELLKRWNGWKKYKNNKCLSIEHIYDDINRYLRINLNNIQKARNRIVLREFNHSCESQESVINVSCSLQRLKTMFYHEPLKYVKYYREKLFVTALPHHLMSSFPQYVFNWPFISTRIDLPNFSMTHQITNIDEFYLVNLTKEFKKESYTPQTTNAFVDSSNKSKQIFSSIIIKFLDQLKNSIDSRDDDKLTSQRKREIIEAVKEFSKDIVLCTDAVDTNTKYYANLNPYPYTRYFGYPDDGVIDLSVPEQKSIKNTKLNVRLQQICHPRISFILEKFNLIYEIKDDDVDFIFDESFLCKLNNCILYKCTLCDVDLGRHSPSQMISEHLLNYHGFEPDWECTNCDNCFTTSDLSKFRWRHDCFTSKRKSNNVINVNVDS